MNKLSFYHYPLSLEINLDNIAHNVRLLKKKIGSQRELMAVVKADGYGHGAAAVARTALENGAGWLAVNQISEALELRDAAIAAPILILGCSSFSACDCLVTNRLSVVISDSSALEPLALAAQKSGVKALIHVKVDTGMGRLGAAPDGFIALAREVFEHPDLELEGALSHFPTADWSDKSFTLTQLETFNALVNELCKLGVEPGITHIANSAAVIDLADCPGDLARTGIAIYGLHPSAATDHGFDLRPALIFRCQVSLVKKVAAGFPVSYGHTFTTKQETTLAIIPVGYAHGFSRGLSNRGEVLIRGVRCPVRGRVCMDSSVVEVPFADLAPGEEAVLIGRQKDDEITVDEWAGLLDTINYEIVTSLSGRVPRIYLENGVATQVRRSHVSYENLT